MLFLPATGIASEYFSGAGLDVRLGLTTLGGVDSGAEDASAAKKASSLHASQSWKIIQYAMIPAHLLNALYHYAQGKDVVRRISPFRM